jgi:hypothetical protein
LIFGPLALQATALPTEIKGILTNAVSRGYSRDFIGCIAKYERVFNGDAKYMVAF